MAGLIWSKVTVTVRSHFVDGPCDRRSSFVDCYFECRADAITADGGAHLPQVIVTIGPKSLPLSLLMLVDSLFLFRVLYRAYIQTSV